MCSGECPLGEQHDAGWWQATEHWRFILQKIHHLPTHSDLDLSAYTCGFLKNACKLDCSSANFYLVKVPQKGEVSTLEPSVSTPAIFISPLWFYLGKNLALHTSSAGFLPGKREWTFCVQETSLTKSEWSYLVVLNFFFQKYEEPGGNQCNVYLYTTPGWSLPFHSLFILSRKKKAFIIPLSLVIYWHKM